MLDSELTSTNFRIRTESNGGRSRSCALSFAFAFALRLALTLHRDLVLHLLPRRLPRGPGASPEVRRLRTQEVEDEADALDSAADALLARGEREVKANSAAASGEGDAGKSHPQHQQSEKYIRSFS